MNPAHKRFLQRYGGIADAVASVDIDQEDRERVANAIAESLDRQPDFRRSTFVLLASDPLVLCSGGCGTRIRVAMHDSGAPNGRSAAWQSRAPEMRCVACGPVTRDG